LQGEFYAPDFVLQEAAEHHGHANVIHMQQAFKVDLWMHQDTPYDQERFAAALGLTDLLGRVRAEAATLQGGQEH
jgi:hypothetical protein